MKNSFRIAVADDDEDDVFLLNTAFQSCGGDCRLSSFSNGEELLRFLNDADELPSLVLLDLNMPRLNGFQTLQRMRQTPRFQSLPVVVVTTSSEQQDVVRSYELGANTFLTKPSSYEKMVEMARLLKTFWLDMASVPAQPIQA